MARNQVAAKLHFLTVREVLAASEGGHTDGGVFGAKLDDINAWIAEKTAQSAQMAGVAQEQRIALNTAQLKGTQVAHLAAGNVDLGTGSAARVLTSTDVLGNIDANTAGYDRPVRFALDHDALEVLVTQLGHS